MLATRTAKGDCQIALAFMNVMGQQIHEQLGDALDELFGLGKGSNVFCDLGVLSGERPELWHKMWIGQETYVEDEVRILRYAVAKAKTHAGNKDISIRFMFLKFRRDIRPKFMHIKSRGVDDKISKRANRT